jgi:hypothetical protein
MRGIKAKLNRQQNQSLVECNSLIASEAINQIPMATTMKQWKVTGKGGFADLKFDENAQVPEVGDKDVLVKRNVTITCNKDFQLIHVKFMPHP